MKKITCGCDCHEIEEDDKNNVVYQSKKWNCICALKETVRLLNKTHDELIRVRHDLAITNDNISKLKCPKCKEEIGEDHGYVNNAYVCLDCLHNMYPNFF